METDRPLRQMCVAVALHIEGFTAFLGEHVSTLVLNQTIEVEAGNAFSNSGLAHTQSHIPFNALPEVALQGGQSNVFLLFTLVLLNDIENHKVVLVHGCESVKVSETSICLMLQSRVEPRRNMDFSSFRYGQFFNAAFRLLQPSDSRQNDSEFARCNGWSVVNVDRV